MGNGIYTSCKDERRLDSAGQNSSEEELVLVGGIWKCGNCAGVDDSMLVYSEANDLDADVIDDPVEVQISLSIPSMRCISVVGERPGLVRRLTGACAGPSVTLSVAAAAHFTVNVYAK
ncbi:uncharacterized protein [Choristoneura fumiferana]|uniref:uncharacterized protein n=1 Tax=Choristoneura fumiferana TaxID=7141 RepID=UPI003D157ACF